LERSDRLYKLEDFSERIGSDGVGAWTACVKVLFLTSPCKVFMEVSYQPTDSVDLGWR